MEQKSPPYNGKMEIRERKKISTNLLRAPSVVSSGLLERGEDPGGLHHVYGPGGGPGDGGRVPLVEDCYLLAVNHELSVDDIYSSLVLAVSRVIPVNEETLTRAFN